MEAAALEEGRLDNKHHGDRGGRGTAESGSGQGKRTAQETAITSAYFYRILERCISTKDIETGRKVQALILRKKLHSSSYLGSFLIRLFSVCGSFTEAHEAFCRLPQPTVFAWTEIISAHAKFGKGQQAIELYHAMQHASVGPDGHAMVAALQACASSGLLDYGKLLHKCALECGLDSNLHVTCSLIDMYAKCENITDAHQVFASSPFRTIILWNALITCYSKHGYSKEAHQLLRQMQQDGLQPNRTTWNAIISGYAQEGDTKSAFLLLKEMQERYFEPDRVTWNGLLTGFGQHGNWKEALYVFQQLLDRGLELDHVTFIGMLQACYSVSALEHGRSIHAHILDQGCEVDALLGNMIIKMYTKCGSLDDARSVFDGLPKLDIETWNSMISSYAQHSNYKCAFQIFESMQEQSVVPDFATFLSVLSACNHLGLASEGCHLFTLMRQKHSLAPGEAHLGCLIDLLGRCGHLIEAKELLEILPVQPCLESWTSLLSHCRTHNNLKMGKLCCKSMADMGGMDSAGYVLLSKIYHNSDMQGNYKHLEMLRAHANAIKKPGQAFIEVQSEVHSFVVGDKSHPKSDGIYNKLNILRNMTKVSGYMPWAADKQTEDSLWMHCEKLALAFGLISLPQGTTIRMMKNLRICDDCHDVIKIISKIERRSIIITDPYRVHQFLNGECSCNDFF